jgi:hypothetical protein
MDSTYIESTTAYKVGWGSSPWRRVSGLLPKERQAVRDGYVVWFGFTPWHYMQSGYKIVTYWAGGPRYDSREPTSRELLNIVAQRAVGLHYENPIAVALIVSAGWAYLYPEVDGYGYLTGRVIDSDDDGFLVVDDVAMVEASTLSEEERRRVDEGWFPVWEEGNGNGT